MGLKETMTSYHRREDRKTLAREPTSREDKMQRRARDLSCSHCPPHRKENARVTAKHGEQKPKYKTKRPLR